MKLIACILFAASLHATTFYVTVAGLGGEPEFEQRFTGWASDLKKSLATVPDSKLDVLEGAEATRANIRGVLERIAKESNAKDALVLILIGHGTFDGADYKFNVPGPDITAIELAGLLDRIPARQLVVNTTSSSGGSILSLRKENRVLISATKSGTEKNATIFARYWVEALGEAAADTDKNDTISALEAFRYAEEKTTKYYETQKRLATEHAVLEDTGKGEGERAPSPENGYGLIASAFPVIRLGAETAALANDPKRRELLGKKDELEQQIDRLKYQKAALPNDEYKKQLGDLLLELAKTQAELDK
jgi:hypothetical protein